MGTRALTVLPKSISMGVPSSAIMTFLDNGVDINEKTGYFSDGTALQRAAENGHMTSVQFLLDSGARIDDHGIGPHNCKTALVRATQSSFEDIALLLVLRGADIFARNQLGETVIHLAMKNEQEKLLLQLTSFGAAVDEFTPTGDTILMIAAEDGLDVAMRTFSQSMRFNRSDQFERRSLA